MDIWKNLYEKCSYTCDMYNNVSCFVSIKVNNFLFNYLPRSIESGMLQQHPKTSITLAGIAWVASKLGFKNESKRVINYAKEKLEKINKGLEGKL